MNTPILNIEFKAIAKNLEALEELIRQQQPLFIGEDHQVDTYFNVPKGRLKLREGNIEHALIYYERENIAGTKTSRVTLYNHIPHPALKEILTKTLGIKTVVDKHRKIFFIDNVKFHLDRVAKLGTFVEVEAIDKDRTIGKEKLQTQCDHYAALLHISKEDFISVSYSDMVIQNNLMQPHLPGTF